MARQEEGKKVAARKRVKGEAGRLKSQIEALPKQVKHESWRIRFLTEELQGATTEVERSVILDWLAEAKERQTELQGDLERCRVEYKLVRGKRGRKATRPAEVESLS